MRFDTIKREDILIALILYKTNIFVIYGSIIEHLLSFDI